MHLGRVGEGTLGTSDRVCYEWSVTWVVHGDAITTGGVGVLVQGHGI